MGQKIQVRRGLLANLPILDNGEVGFATDTKDFYIGDGTTNNLINGIQGNPSKKYKVVGCVVRNDGTGWQQITSTGHAPISLQTVTADTSKISIIYNFTAKNVVSFVACPDETMSSDNIFMGASVGTTQADISLYQHKSLGGYVYYNGSSWAYGGTNDNGISAVFNAGTLTITHPTISGVKANVACRDGGFVTAIGALGATTTEVKFYDYAGTLVTTPSTNMKIYFERVSSSNALDPTTYVNAGANIWCYGIFEV